MEIFNIENLSFKYPNSNMQALSNINLTVNSGDFLLLIGESGCGKTTLLRLLKKEFTIAGEREGLIFYKGNKIEFTDDKTSSEIGFIMQNPDSQIVSDKVYSELAFGLENLGCDQYTIRLRVSEFAAYFGISDLFNKSTNQLSGGQKQMVNLASVMAMNPDVLILDEPTSQLDPISAVEFINTLKRLNNDFGTTIIMAEHRLQDCFAAANRTAVMEKSKIIFCDTPRNVCSLVKGHNISLAMPASVRVYNELDIGDNCPLNVKEGREYLSRYFSDVSDFITPKITKRNSEAVKTKDIWFRYSKNSIDVLKGCNLSVYKGEIYVLLGANGSGKTTLMNVLCGGIKPYRGKVKTFGNKVSYLSQNPRDIFVKETVEDDFKMIDNSYTELCNRFSLTSLLNKHPYDLSGGELQKAAVCKIMLTKPDVILLDEPTKGLDAFAKRELGKFFSELAEGGITVIIVSHDIEFAGEYAHRCGLLFDGIITAENYTNPFFANNDFYTTTASRMSRHIFKNAVTVDDIVTLCKRRKESG